MTIVLVLLGLIGAILVLGLAAYLIAPRVIYGLAWWMLRRRAGLTQKSISVDGVSWPYLEGGKADGATVVLLHGFAADKDAWTLYAKHLTARYRVIAPDLQGFGENDRDPKADYSIAPQAARVRAFLDAVGVERCHLSGNSMGGFIALRFALDYPERLNSLTLMNSAGVIGETESALQIGVNDGRNLLAVETVSDVDRLMDFLAHKPSPIPQGFKKIIFEEYDTHRVQLDSVFWKISEEALNHPLTDRLGAIDTPTLIIWGRHDQLIDVSCVDVLAAGIANAETVIFDDMAHIPMLENPGKTAAAHLAFLERR